MPVSDSAEVPFIQPRLPRRAVLLGVAAAAVGSTLTACAGNSSGVPPAPTPSTANTSETTKGSAQTGSSAVVVTMNDQYRFVPDSITVKKGQTIEWRNTSASPHTVTDDPSKAQDKLHAVLPAGAQPWDSGMIDPGKSFTVTLTVEGEYSYFCIPHESMGMVGKIKVT